MSAYYPIIRSSPVFIVVFSVLFLSESYPLVVLLGIALAVAGGFLLLYKRGTNFLEDPGTLGLALLAMSGTGIYSLADARLMETLSAQAQMTAANGILVPVYAFLWWRRQRAAGPLQPAQLRGFTPTHLLVPGVLAYLSYYLILLAYERGADVASVTTLRQASIPISVALAGLFLREGAIVRRFCAAGLLALGLVIIALTG